MCACTRVHTAALLEGHKFAVTPVNLCISLKQLVFTYMPVKEYAEVNMAVTVI